MDTTLGRFLDVFGPLTVPIERRPVRGDAPRMAVVFGTERPWHLLIEDGEPAQSAAIDAGRVTAFGPQEPPDNPMIFNRRQPDGTFRRLAEFFDAVTA